MKRTKNTENLSGNIFFFKISKEWKGNFTPASKSGSNNYGDIDVSQGYHSQVRAAGLGFVFSTNLLHKSLCNDFQQVQGKWWLLFFYHPTWSSNILESFQVHWRDFRSDSRKFISFSFLPIINMDNQLSYMPLTELSLMCHNYLYS